MTNTRKRVLRTLLTLLITPFALVLVLGILLYLPPIQRWAVRQAASYLSSQTGIEVTLDRVRLSFPLDVSLGGVRAVQDGDTLLAVNSVLVDLDMKRLLSLSIGVDAVELADGTLHTGQMIPAVSINGTVGLLHLDAEAISMKERKVKAVSALLERSDIEVTLHESTEEEDTTTSPAPLWSIAIDRAEVSQSRLLLHMPGDSMRIEAGIRQLLLQQGDINLHRGTYTAQSLTLRADSPTIPCLPQAASTHRTSRSTASGCGLTMYGST